jgi:hypothetical protein
VVDLLDRMKLDLVDKMDLVDRMDLVDTAVTGGAVAIRTMGTIWIADDR